MKKNILVESFLNFSLTSVALNPENLNRVQNKLTKQKLTTQMLVLFNDSTNKSLVR